MDSFSIWHWLIMILWVLVVGWPIARILQRAGFSGWWTIMAFLPFLNLVGLWIFAMVSWPNVPNSAVRR